MGKIPGTAAALRKKGKNSTLGDKKKRGVLQKGGGHISIRGPVTNSQGKEKTIQETGKKEKQKIKMFSGKGNTLVADSIGWQQRGINYKERGKTQGRTVQRAS